MGLVGTAGGRHAPLTIVNLVISRCLMCRRVRLEVKRYFLSVAIGPAIHVLPFAICLVGARLIFRTEPLIGLACGAAVGGTILGAVYWRYVLPRAYAWEWFGC